MNSSKENQYSKTLYALAGIGIAGLLGGVYFLVNLFKEPEMCLDEEQEKELDVLTEKLNEKSGELTVETAVQIMAMINKVTEEKIRSEHPDLDDRRREALKNNDKDYDQLCQESFMRRTEVSQDASQFILSKFGISEQALQEFFQNYGNPQEIEKLLQTFDKPIFDGEMPSATITKEAFLYYGKKIITVMQSFFMESRQYTQQQYMADPMLQQEQMIKMMILKLRVDDELHIKYKVTEQQVRYLLVKYNLLDDHEVKAMTSKISKFDN